MLELTYKELDGIIGEEFDRFEVLNDDIPKEGHSRQYIEDDGRQYRWLEFLDHNTGETYGFSYIWYPDGGFEGQDSIFDENKLGGIKIVKTSVENLYPVPTPKIEPVKVLTAEEQADAELCDLYKSMLPEMQPMGKDRKVPKSVISDIINYINSSTAKSIMDLRAKIYPVCIQYKVEQKSFWTFIQKKRGVWK